MTDDLDFLTETADEDRSSVEYRQQALVLELSGRVLSRIEDLGISQAELARRMGVSRPMITKLLTGDSNFQLKTLIRLSDALEMDFVADFVPKGFALPHFYISRDTGTVDEYTLSASLANGKTGSGAPKKRIVPAGGRRSTADYSVPSRLKVA